MTPCASTRSIANSVRSGASGSRGIEGGARVAGDHGQRSQHRAHRRRAGLRQLQRQRDQLVVAFRHLVEHEVLEHAHVVREQLLVAVERLAAAGSTDCGVDADEPHALRGQPRDGLGAKAENDRTTPSAPSQQVRTSTRGGSRLGRMRQVLGRHERALVDRVNDAARPEKRIEIDLRRSAAHRGRSAAAHRHARQDAATS